MTYKKPEEIWVFRIVHYQNIEHILKIGLHTVESSFAHPNYIPIGDTSLISHRNTFPVKINPPNGVLGMVSSIFWTNLVKTKVYSFS